MRKTGNRKTSIRATLSKMLGLALALSVGWSTWAAVPLPPDHPRRTLPGAAFGKLAQVERGSEQAAKDYYQGVVSRDLKFLTSETILGSDVRQLLDYFGFTAITAAELHRSNSAQLMQRGDAGDILATSFFAPKITSVAEPPREVPESGFGWRKLIRFRAKPGSPAATNGLESVWFLQNLFEKTIAADPFDSGRNVSRFNQAMLIRSPDGGAGLPNSAYFLTYGTLVDLDESGLPKKDASGNFVSAGKLTTSLKASFDGRDPEANRLAEEYFVPEACIECHGRSARRVKLNFLDTDHWFDRVSPNYGLEEPSYRREDFTALAGSSFGVLYDGGKDPAAPVFGQAFDVIRKLNAEIRNQNAAAGGTVNNFQLQAVDKWLELHRADQFGLAHVTPYRRGFGDHPWSPERSTHRQLLYYLNRYCYRCHSSVKYNVFDRRFVREHAFDLASRVQVRDASQVDVWMPQDRVFPGLEASEISGDLKVFVNLLNELESEPE